MAGIAGMFGPKASRATVEKMLETIAHRGPASRRALEGPGFSLGCCEGQFGGHREHALAGGDLEAIALDGIIHNRDWVNHRDADSLWALRQKFGYDCVSKLKGAYAVAIAGGDDLLLARDPVGSRPLFYGQRDDTISFASEAKALRGVTDNVRELLPGMIYSSRRHTQRLPVIRPEVPSFRTRGKARRVLRELLEEVVYDKVKDGSVGGLALSGGLDSSIIAVLARKYLPQLELYTFGLRGSADPDYARQVAAHLGAQKRHYVYTVEPSIAEETVRQAIWHLESFEEDCVNGCVANLLASRFVRRHTSCCLCGEGADELFAGYRLVRDLPDRQRQQSVLDKLFDTAYATSLRRLDRAWMANSVEYRAPFLDTRIVDFARQVPVHWKTDKSSVGKRILRDAFHDLLPEGVVERDKAQFASGSSVDTVLTEIGRTKVSAEEFESHRVTPSGFRLRSPIELWYYRIYKEMFPDEAYEQQVVRWNPVM
jgi:asparagine synthase (glutamine-hydrolysing)